MTIQVHRILELPIEALAELLDDSRIERFRAVDRLVHEWLTQHNRFDRAGEALWIARNHDRIVGVCGLNRDPYTNSAQIGRVRRLYVMQDSRRQGIGQMLVCQTIQEAKQSFDWLHVRTTNPAAAQFYQSLGFTRCISDSVTHALELAAVDREAPFRSAR